MISMWYCHKYPAFIEVYMHILSKCHRSCIAVVKLKVRVDDDVVLYWVVEILDELVADLFEAFGFLLEDDGHIFWADRQLLTLDVEFLVNAIINVAA